MPTRRFSACILGVLLFATSCGAGNVALEQESAAPSKSTSSESTSTAPPAPSAGQSTAVPEGLAADGVTIPPDPSWCGSVVRYLDVPTDSSSEDGQEVFQAETEAALERAQGAASTPGLPPDIASHLQDVVALNRRLLEVGPGGLTAADNELGQRALQFPIIVRVQRDCPATSATIG